MKKNKIKLLLLSALAISTLSLGACTIAMPGVMFTNGSSPSGDKKTDIKASKTAQVLLGFIGLDDASTGKNQDALRQDLEKQCAGGRIEGISGGTTITNYIFLQEYKFTEHATCIQGSTH